LPYPNPVLDPGPIQVQVALGQPTAKLTLSVFTTAYRKVNEVQYKNLPAGTVDLSFDPVDRNGVPLANGLYYLVVKTGAGQSIGKLIISK
jgi:hypothetical protein